MADIRINALATTATSAASDDYLALDGSANGTRKILATNVAQNVTDVTLGSAGPSVKSTLSARAPRQGLVFDGTAGATVANVPALGTTYTIAAWVNPANVSGAKAIVATAAQNPLYISGADVYSAGGAAGLTVASGKTQLVVLSASAGTVTPYLNAIAGTSYTDSTSVTAPVAIGSNSTGTTYAWNGALSVLIYNRALSASEVVALYEAGAPSGADYGSPAASNTSLSSSAFVNSALPYGTFTGSSATGFTAAEVSATAYAYSAPAFTVKTGSRIRVSFTATLTSGQAPIVRLDEVGVAARSANQTVVAGSNSFDLVATGGGSVRIIFLTTAATSYAISSFSAVSTGLLLAPDAAQAGGGYVWNDQSGNLAQIVLPSSGVQWNLPSVAGQRIRSTTSTNGNQQLLGASVLLPAECQITHVRARARSGTPTITIGTASGGAQIVASVALSTTWLNCTIALTGGIVSSADDIWIGSNSTDVVEIDIAFQPLDF